MEQWSQRLNVLCIFLRGLFAYIWLHVSTAVFSILCVFGSLCSRRFGYALGKIWGQLLLVIAGARMEIRGLDNLKPGHRYTVLCNHQSYLDIPILMSATPLYLYFVAKKELFNVPFFGWGLKALGHIPIDRHNSRKALDNFTQAARLIRSQEHMSLVLFPEGTRSADGSLGEFRQGSFSLVIEAGLPVVPAAIRGSRMVLPKGSLLARPGRVTITFGDPMDISGHRHTDKRMLMEQVRKKITDMML